MLAAHLRSLVVTFEPHLRTIRGNRVEVLSTTERRLELLEGAASTMPVKPDDALAALSPEAFADSMLRAAGVEVVAEGDGFRFGHGRSGDLDLLARLGFDVRRVPLVDNVSSTHIRQLLAAGEVTQAAQLLGRPAELPGTVVLGDQRGEALGFPTANLALPPTSSCRRSGSTQAPRSVIERPSRSARIRTTAAPSGGSRPSCSTSSATSTGRSSGSSSRLWERFRDEAAFGSRRS